MAKFVLLLVLDTIDPLSTIKLVPQNFISLHKSVQLCCQVLILNLQHMSMSLKSLLLLYKVVMTPLVLLVEAALAFYISSGHEKGFFFFFQAQF